MKATSTVTQFSKSSEPADIQLFLNNNQRLIVIKLLCRLTQAVQQHRGATTAVLSGDKAFLALVEERQDSIQRMLHLLEQVNGPSQELIARPSIDNILNEWKTIAIGWRQDKMMDNFQFHSHLVGSLHKIIRESMMEKLLPDLGEQQNKPLFIVVFIKLPELNEYMAMLRGLCADVIAQKSCNGGSQVRIEYLVKLVRKESDAIIKILENMTKDITAAPTVDIILGQKKHLKKLLLTIQVTILEATEIYATGSHLFDMATSVIDAHWLAIEQGIQHVDHAVYEYSIK